MHPYSVFKKLWEWQVTCSLCGYKSGWHNRSLAVILSLWHTLRKHPHGYNTIGAAEKGRDYGRT